MSPPYSAQYFEEGPSMDSGIGLLPSPARTPPDASELSRQSSYYHQSPSSYEALYSKLWDIEDTTPVSVDNSNRDSPHNSVRFASQTAQSSSRPASATSSKGDGRSIRARNSQIPPRPQTPYPRQRKAEANETPHTVDAEEVLGPQKGRKTPVLMNAPDLQWDLSKPPFVMQSRSTLDDVEEAGKKEEVKAERRSARKVERAGTPIPTSAPAKNYAQHRKAKSKPHHAHPQGIASHILTSPPGALPPTQSSLKIYTVKRQNTPSPEQQPSPSPTPHIPALLRVLDANLQAQPHQLNSLPESDERAERSQSRPQLSPFPRCCQTMSGDAFSLDRSYLDDPRNQDGSGSLCTQRTRETDPYPFTTTETLGVQTAHMLPVQRVERSDIRCGHVSIASRRCCGVLDLNSEEEYVGAAGTPKVGARVRKAWDRVRGLFCRKEEGLSHERWSNNV
ncbi:hypothetical protein COCMIDRAFT_81680 [Bipolaris oryzae ATCC 44560]|uniref:Uncharacterized protein n=1 Tax=Bipolaris oryzae ATCC 44560 TaxID=930090 RepID=W6ZFL2_COCMI|nr:uncharacterized protein COCMIDRAFT_81680 [Bipolaris oryzae ATCC 44560]EUC50632.1 hypothetical protein COCMIDRAFT_81680 [Bipolaris oryzae ATCC 44560]